LGAEAVFFQPGVKKRAARSFRMAQQTGLAALAFVSLHTMRLRGEKSTGHSGASVPGLGTDLSEVSEPTARND
jgi:hypothetical protein